LQFGDELLSVPVEIYKESEIEYLPRELLFPPLANYETATKELTVLSHKKAFQIHEVYSDLQDVEFSYVNGISKKHTILVRLLPREKIEGIYRSYITLKLGENKEEVKVKCAYYLQESKNASSE
jgi:hypothetical protein